MNECVDNLFCSYRAYWSKQCTEFDVDKNFNNGLMQTNVSMYKQRCGKQFDSKYGVFSHLIGWFRFIRKDSNGSTFVIIEIINIEIFPFGSVSNSFYSINNEMQ